MKDSRQRLVERTRAEQKLCTVIEAIAQRIVVIISSAIRAPFHIRLFKKSLTILRSKADELLSFSVRQSGAFCYLVETRIIAKVLEHRMCSHTRDKEIPLFKGLLKFSKCFVLLPEGSVYLGDI